MRHDRFQKKTNKARYLEKISIILAGFSVFGVTAGECWADNNQAALQMIGRAYQMNYYMQSQLPANASMAQRAETMRRAFAPADKVAAEVITQRQQALRDSQTNAVKQMKNYLSAQEAERQALGIDPPASEKKKLTQEEKQARQAKLAEAAAAGKLTKMGKMPKTAALSDKPSTGPAKADTARKGPTRDVASEAAGAIGASDVTFKGGGAAKAGPAEGEAGAEQVSFGGPMKNTPAPKAAPAKPAEKAAAGFLTN